MSSAPSKRDRVLVLGAVACGPQAPQAKLAIERRSEPRWRRASRRRPTATSPTAQRRRRRPRSISRSSIAATIDELDRATAHRRRSTSSAIASPPRASRCAPRGSRIIAATMPMRARCSRARRPPPTKPRSTRSSRALARRARRAAGRSRNDRRAAAAHRAATPRSARELRAAIELAPPDGTKWLFLDTRGEPDGAAAAVETAAREGRGRDPRPRRHARGDRRGARGVAARRSRSALLAPADGADPSAGVFRLVGSPADEGRAVARARAGRQLPDRRRVRAAR